MHNTYMTAVSSTRARQRWAETLEAARSSPVRIRVHGRDVAVLMNAELADRALAALEDQEDTRAAEAALADEGPWVTLEELASELGINLDE